MRQSTADVEKQRSNRTDEPNRSSSIAIRNRFPEQWSEAQNRNLQRRQIRCSCDRRFEFFGDVLVCWNDSSCDECCHHGMECDAGQVCQFLPLWPIVRIRWICRRYRIKVQCAMATDEIVAVFLWEVCCFSETDVCGSMSDFDVGACSLWLDLKLLVV